MARRLALTGLFLVLAASAFASTGCSGADGATGPAGAAGPTGDPGPTGDTGPSGTSTPSVSGITPGAAFLDRTVDVVISGYGTEWTDSTAVDFGANVTVNSLKAASPTAIAANITIGADATLGARDVKVGDLTYAGAFQLQSPIKLSALGTIAQGSLAVVDANGLDFTTPFDTTYTGDGLFTPIEYTNIQVSALPGTSVSVSSVEPYRMSMMFFFDLDVSAGAKDIDILSGPAGTQTHFPYPGALNVAARTATDLAAGTPATGNIADAYGSAIYKFTPNAAGDAISLSVTSSSADAVPGIIILPKSGKFADLIAYTAATTITADSTDPMYLIIWDNYGTADYDFTLSALKLTTVDENEPNNDMNHAQAVTTLPALFDNATLSSATDEDWIAITATAADVGKSIHVTTGGSDPYTDTVVDIFKSDGTTSLGGPSDDQAYLDSLVSSPIPAAGTYYIKIYASDYFDPASDTYNAAISIQ